VATVIGIEKCRKNKKNIVLFVGLLFKSNV
jgi:hypothetical protein